MARNPPKRRMKKAQPRALRYLSMNPFMVGPNFQKSAATPKKRRERLMVEARTKRGKFILNTPEVMVKIL